MDRFRKIIETIKSQLGGLTGSQKLLAGCLAVIAGMTLFLVSQYAGQKAMVGLINDDPNINLVQTLRGSGIDAQLDDGTIVVPPSQQRRAVATLAQAGQLPGNTTIMFGNLMEFQDWKNPRQQNRQQYLLALQNELARVIGLYQNVSAAQVFIDAPEPTGLGRASRAPTASVNVVTMDQGGLTQKSVDAIARLVSGPVAGLTPANVGVVDPSGPRRVTDESEMLSNSWLEQATKIERVTEQKLRSFLGDIPGVVVSVNAQVDVTRVTESTLTHLKNNEGTVSVPRSETVDESVDESSKASAEPGVRSNQSADINTGAAGLGTNSTRTQTTTDYQVGLGVNQRQVMDPRGMPTFLAASVAIPQTYIENLLTHAKARAAGTDAADAEPAPLTDQEVQQRFDVIKAQFEALLLPQLAAVGADGTRTQGEITVSMIPVLGGAIVQSLGGSGFISTVPSVAGTGSMGLNLGPLGPVSVETIMVGVLAVVSLAMMLLMARKAGRPADLPTATEVVGVPPALRSEESVVGEAGETDTPMEGIEVDELQVKTQKMLDQVNELVGDNPLVASRLLGRWIEAE
ncbi:MAG: flagellar M-ring protein FliF [Phycisphaerales bacterium]|jgi:flagellar M-ring protein FliF